MRITMYPYQCDVCKKIVAEDWDQLRDRGWLVLNGLDYCRDCVLKYQRKFDAPWDKP